MKNKIPTAEEFATADNSAMLPRGVSYYKEIGELMIEFAKLHVKCALEAAANDAKMTQIGLGFDAIDVVDKDSILNAYPENLIK